MRWRASAFAAALAGAAAAAQPGAVETMRELRARDAQPIPMRPYGDRPFLDVIEGAATLVAWRIAGAATSLEVARGEQARREAEGWTTVLFCAAAECGGFDFRAALMVLAPPAMRLDLFDFHQLTMQRGGVFLSVLVSRAGDTTFMQSVTVEPTTSGAPGPTTAAPPPSTSRPAPVAPTAAPPAPPAAAASGSVNALGAALERDGRVVLEGVVFEAGSSAPAPSSTATLDAAAAMLAARRDLSVAVIGHTDGAGALAVNQRISAARAEAVLEALAARGVVRGRMEAAGAGWMAPRAPNTTEAGRALNRRVELVAR